MLRVLYGLMKWKSTAQRPDIEFGIRLRNAILDKAKTLDVMYVTVARLSVLLRVVNAYPDNKYPSRLSYI